MSLAVFDVQVHEVKDLLLQVAADIAKIRRRKKRARRWHA